MWEWMKESVTETLSSPTDLALLAVIGYFAWRMFGRREPQAPPPPPELPPLAKRDLTMGELREWDGKGEGAGEKDRILMAVDGVIFDVSRAKHLYGPEGPYGLFAGRDASRGLATFEITAEAVKDEVDDLSDLGAYERDSLQEWKRQFQEKYPVVGKLLKAGEAPSVYEDEDAKAADAPQ